MNSVTQWLKTAPVRISNETLQKSIDLEFKRRKGELFTKHKAKAVIDTRGVCPSIELSQVGIWRQAGQARICGDFIEVYITTSDYVMGGYRKPITDVSSKTEEKAKHDEISSIARSAKRAEKNIRRLVNCNRLRYMWTLTFAPPSEENAGKWKCVDIEQQRNISTVKRLFRNFYLTLQRKFPGIKWLVVYELHDSRQTSSMKRGTWHIHFATDCFLDFHLMVKIWKHGISRGDDFAKPKKGVRNGPVQNPGAYMSKYIGKNFDKTNRHIKRYSRSRNMQTPETISFEELLNRFPGLTSLHETFHTTVVHEYDGLRYYNHNITYRRYANGNPRKIPRRKAKSLP